MSNEIYTPLIMFDFSSLSDDIILSILQYVILQDLSNIGTRCDIIKAFVCSSKKTLQIFRSHEDFVGIQELLKIMRVYIKAYDEKMGQSEYYDPLQQRWKKPQSVEDWESDLSISISNLSNPIYINYGNYLITRYGALNAWIYGLVNFKEDNETKFKYRYQYRYQDENYNRNYTEVYWSSKTAILGFYHAGDILRIINGELWARARTRDNLGYTQSKILNARNARDVLKGVNMYVLSRESFDEYYFETGYQDTKDVEVILPGGTLFLDLIADCMISYIQHTTRFKNFVGKIPIIFNSEEKGYIRSGPFDEHPLENYKLCHYFEIDVNRFYDPENDDCDCPSCTNKQYRVVIDNEQEQFLDGPEGTTKTIIFLPN
tara:strand:- start:204 stop:1325 length:1122 start_codon:yes stop_codon:yes gene_type:complete